MMIQRPEMHAELEVPTRGINIMKVTCEIISHFTHSLQCPVLDSMGMLQLYTKRAITPHDAKLFEPYVVTLLNFRTYIWVVYGKACS